MEEKWKELLVVLQEMINIYQEILTLSRQKKQILIDVNSNELALVTQQEEVLIIQVGKLEIRREKLVREIMDHHGIIDNSVIIEHLPRIATPDVMEKIKTFHKEFEAIIAEMVPLNKLNTELVNQTLGFINYNINILSQTAVGPTYAAKGQNHGEAPRRKVFDARV